MSLPSESTLNSHSDPLVPDREAHTLTNGPASFTLKQSLSLLATASATTSASSLHLCAYPAFSRPLLAVLRLRASRSRTGTSSLNIDSLARHPLIYHICHLRSRVPAFLCPSLLTLRSSARPPLVGSRFARHPAVSGPASQRPQEANRQGRRRGGDSPKGRYPWESYFSAHHGKWWQDNGDHRIWRRGGKRRNGASTLQVTHKTTYFASKTVKAFQGFGTAS